jgi:hypothetical protein
VHKDFEEVQSSPDLIFDISKDGKISNTIINNEHVLIVPYH